MRYLSIFKLSQRRVKNPNLYPYNVFAGKDIDCLVFDNVTVLYGSNASGKSTLLNILSHKLKLEGAEEVSSFSSYIFNQFINESSFGLGEDEQGCGYRKVPENSRYIKSEKLIFMQGCWAASLLLQPIRLLCWEP